MWWVLLPRIICKKTSYSMLTIRSGTSTSPSGNLEIRSCYSTPRAVCSWPGAKPTTLNPGNLRGKKAFLRCHSHRAWAGGLRAWLPAGFGAFGGEYLTNQETKRGGNPAWQAHLPLLQDEAQKGILMLNLGQENTSSASGSLHFFPPAHRSFPMCLQSL